MGNDPNPPAKETHSTAEWGVRANEMKHSSEPAGNVPEHPPRETHSQAVWGDEMR